jgi:hypothetical protein
MAPAPPDAAPGKAWSFRTGFGLPVGEKRKMDSGFLEFEGRPLDGRGLNAKIRSNPDWRKFAHFRAFGRGEEGCHVFGVCFWGRRVTVSGHEGLDRVATKEAIV